MPIAKKSNRVASPRATAPRRNGHRRVTRLPSKQMWDARGVIIDMMASGAPLTDTLTAIARMVEHLAKPALCSVLLLESDGKHLRNGAGPSLPEEYSRAINGLEIGPSVGSCGTAAYRKEPVIVSDIATDPLWEGPREFALSFGLRACWSMPVIDDTGTVLGTIALYFRKPRKPSARDFGLLRPGAGLVRLALAQHRREEDFRAAEARIRLAADAADLGTYDIDLVTGVPVWSDRFKAIFGLPPTVAPDNAFVVATIHPDDRTRFERDYTRWITGTVRTARSGEYRIIRADNGAERNVVLSGRILVNSQNMASRAIGIVSDITEQRAAERAQRNAQRQIHELQKMEAVGQLAGGIAHDLNNTLMPILGLTKLAMQEISPLDPLGEHLALIHRSGERARDLVNQILTFSRKEEIARAPVELATMVEESLPLLRVGIHDAIKIETHVEGNPIVWANRGQIDQVLINLVNNAGQAIGRRTGSIRIEIAVEGAGDKSAPKMARLSVIDDGPGIDPSVLQRLFEPFFTTKRVGEGTGLGLAVAHGIVTNHGGRIEVSSRLGEGAKFHIYLPLFKTADAAPPAPHLEHA